MGKEGLIIFEKLCKIKKIKIKGESVCSGKGMMEDE